MGIKIASISFCLGGFWGTGYAGLLAHGRPSQQCLTLGPVLLCKRMGPMGVALALRTENGPYGSGTGLKDRERTLEGWHGP